MAPNKRLLGRKQSKSDSNNSRRQRRAPASVDFIFASYCADHKAQRDPSVLLESYRKFVIAHLGEVEARPLIALAEQRWGRAA